MERFTDRDERPWYRQRAFDTAMSAMDALYEFMRRSEYVDPALRNQVRERLVKLANEAIAECIKAADEQAALAPVGAPPGAAA